ncbi:DUF2079 domain-containing protein [Leptolyngbya sp. AN02str]|uniref:DUF2079 domain-containing protein n=1 Tax=Leptolyngbya sp. AN02str TaxID=3423363 RepID=UPI003D30F434
MNILKVTVSAIAPMIQRLTLTRELRTVGIVAIVFWMLCCVFVVQRYALFYPTHVAFDQGIFNQVFWNTLHGRWFESSLSSTESVQVLVDGQPPEVFYRRLGQHFTPALLLWVPYYALVQSPAGLSVLQVSLVTAGGLVLYALARHYVAPALALFITLGYYCSNAVIGPTLANFHDLCQLPLYGFGLLLAFEKRMWSVFWLLAGLTLLVREDTGILLFGIGAYLVLSRRAVIPGVVLSAVSVGYILLATNVLMPLFSDDISRRFMVEQFGHFVENQQASPPEVLVAILRQPTQLLQELVSPGDRTLNYVLGQILPLAFVSLLSPSTGILVAFPLLKTLIRQDPTALSLQLRYAITLVPGLFYGAILWWAAHPQWFQPKLRRFWALCLTLALIFTVLSNPNRALSIAIPDSIDPWVYVTPARQWQHAQAMRTIMAHIPDHASVSATGYALSHLSNRRAIVRYPEVRIRNDAQQATTVDDVLVDFWYPVQLQVAFRNERRDLADMERQFTALLESGYGIIAFEDGIGLLRNHTQNLTQALSKWQAWHDRLQPIIQSTPSP